MIDVVAWLRERAATLESRPYGAIAASVLLGAAEDLETLLPKAAP